MEVTEGGWKENRLKNPNTHEEKINQLPLASVGVSQAPLPITYCVVLFKLLTHWVAIIAS